MQTATPPIVVSTDARRSYYRDLADLTRMFWQYYTFDSRGYLQTLGGSTLQREIASALEKSQKPQDIMGTFVEEVATDIFASLKCFLYQQNPYSPEQARLVKSDLMSKLLFRAYNAANLMTKVSLSPGPALPPLEEILRRGVSTGLSVTAMLIEISYSVKSLNVPMAALMLSKIDLSNLQHVAAHMGFPPAITGFPEKNGDYLLIDPGDAQGINRKLLRELGYPAELGCPAGMKPSQECRAYLEAEFGASDAGKTMAELLAAGMAKSFESQVIPWFKSLNHEQRTRMIRAEDLTFLEGRFLDSPGAYRRIDCGHGTKTA